MKLFSLISNLTTRNSSSNSRKRKRAHPRFVPRVEGLEGRVVPAGLQLRLEQAGFAALTITDQGPGDINSAVGVITFSGSYGTYNINTTTGLSKPVVGNGTTQAQLDLDSVNFSTTVGGTLKITLADTDYTFPTGSLLTFDSSVGGTLSGAAGSTVTFQSWANANNLSPLPGSPTTIPPGSASPGQLGPFGPGSYSTTASTTFTRGAGPFSLFHQATISLDGPGNAGFNLISLVTGEADHADGRMTGGGSIFTTAGDSPGPGIRVTHGFELHCDLSIQPNRLEINIHNPARDRFHLESLTSVTCLDDPAIDPGNPSAPIDTYIGVGKGRFNGVSGYTINFTFTDAGEPGRDDTAKYLIWLDSNNNGVVDGSETPLLQTGPKKLTFGNHQAHEEHKKPGTTTLSFWTANADTRANPDVWPPTGWTKNTRVKAAFSAASSSPYGSLGNDNLAKALTYAGGSTLTGAAQTLLRIGTETLLSASHPNVAYPISAAEIQSRVNAALNSQNVATILTEASQLQALDAVKYWTTEIEPLRLDGELTEGSSAATLTSEELQPFIAAAFAHWQAAGVDPEQLAALSGMVAQVVDLPGDMLGAAGHGAIWIDQDAAGFGWSSVDPYTVVTHEIGHLFGFEHGNNDIMAERLPVGVRRLLGPAPETAPAPAVYQVPSANLVQPVLLFESYSQPSYLTTGNAGALSRLQAEAPRVTSPLADNGSTRSLLASTAAHHSGETSLAPEQPAIQDPDPEPITPAGASSTDREILLPPREQESESIPSSPGPDEPPILDEVSADSPLVQNLAAENGSGARPVHRASAGLLGLTGLLFGGFWLGTAVRPRRQTPALKPTDRK